MSNNRKTRQFLLAAILGLAAGIASATLIYSIPDLGPIDKSAKPGDAQTVTTGKALIGGAFSLLDPTGKRVSEADFSGKPMLVYFGFTHCPDICPAGLQVIAAALEKLGPKAEGLTPLFITVDPARDTPEVVGPYAASFDKRIIGLSGTPDDIAKVGKAYRVYMQKAGEPGAKDYSVDHSSFMYLMNSKGEFVKHFPHTVSADTLATELGNAL